MSSSDTLNLKDILLSTTDDTYNRKYSHFGRVTYYLSEMGMWWSVLHISYFSAGTQVKTMC